MRLYLDNCCLQRPLDDQSHPRIRVETEAAFVVFAAVQAGAVRLLGSEALDYEVSRIPDPTRRTEAMAVLALASEHVQITDAAETMALGFERHGLAPMDALHLALAVTAQADYFCTCDDRFLRKARSLADLGCQVTTLLNLIPEIVK